jgi:hypothetical protein
MGAASIACHLVGQSRECRVNTVIVVVVGLVPAGMRTFHDRGVFFGKIIFRRPDAAKERGKAEK